MNRENILFSVVGLLLGYVIAFHIVVHINQGQAAQNVAAAASGEGLPADHPSVAGGAGGAEQQRLWRPPRRPGAPRASGPRTSTRR